MNHLVEIRKNLVTDRVRENQDKTPVEDKGRELLTIRRRGLLSGDNVRLRKVQNADPFIINYLRSLFLEAEDETELKFENVCSFFEKNKRCLILVPRRKLVF